MEFKSYKTVQINDDVALAVNEAEKRVQIIVSSGPFGGAREVMLTFEEFRLIINALQVLELERSVVKKPKKKREE